MAHKILCRVDGHMVRARTEDGEPIVAGTVEHWEMDTELGEEWGDLAVRVTWTGAGEAVTQDFEPTMVVPWEAIAEPCSLRLSFVGVAPYGVEVVRTEYMSVGIPVVPSGADLGAPAQAATEDIVHAAQRNLADLATHVADAGAVVERAQQAVGDAGRAAESATSAAQSATTAAGQAASASSSANTAAATATKAATDLRAAADRGDFDGAPGTSPSATVSKSGHTVTITLRDANGTTTAQVSDGDPGDDYVLTDADRTTIAAEAAGMVELPAATATTLGGVKVGEHLSVAADGTLSASASGVHVGPDEPTDDSTVWIDPSGEAVVPVRDVTLAGTSIVSGGVASVPVAANGAFGVMKAGLGITASANGTIYTSPAQNSLISSRVAEDGYSVSYNNREVITPSHLDYAVTAAMTDGKGTAWTAEQQAAARERIGDAPWELVETITLAENVTQVDRIVTPSGQAWDFMEIRVVCKCPAWTESGYLYHWISVNGEWYRLIGTSNGVNTSVAYSHMRASVRGGLLDSTGSSLSSNVLTSNSTFSFRNDNSDKVVTTGINGWRVTTNASAIPSGCKFEIFARKW